MDRPAPGPDLRRLRPPAAVLMRVIHGEAVILNLDSERYFGLDDASTHMWQVITESATVEEAVLKLLGEYDVVEDTLRADVDAFVADLVAEGLLADEGA
jgi:hypothetical protein